MSKFIVTLLAVFSVCACTFETAFETAGLPDAPTVWRAWVKCDGKVEALEPNTAVELPGGWQCIAHASDGQASVTCWAEGEHEIELGSACETEGERKAVWVGECMAQIACSSAVQQ